MAEHLKVPNLDGLTELANRDGVDIKPTLLRVMTDLYVQKLVHSAEEERHYIELAMRLIDRVDAATRSIVADRLASYAGAPRVVLERLTRGRVHRGETAVAAAPATPNPMPVVSATPTELSELFLAADAQDRRMILLNLEYATLPLAASIAPQAAQDAIRRLEMAALNHNSERCAQEVERALGIGRTLARRLMDDQSGETVLVLAVALGMPSDVLQRILLCLNPAISHSVLRVYELSRLYEELEPKSALRLVAIWQAVARPAQHAPVHQPIQYDDRKDRPILPTRPAIRWEEHAPLRREGER